MNGPNAGADFRFVNHGSVFLVEPLNTKATKHLSANVDDEAQWFGRYLVVEPRYVAPLAAALRSNGYSVQ